MSEREETHREIWMLWVDELGNAEANAEGARPGVYVSVFDVKDNIAYMRGRDNVFSSVEEAKIACAVAGAEWRELRTLASDEFVNAITIGVFILEDDGISVAELEKNTVGETETSS